METNLRCSNECQVQKLSMEYVSRNFDFSKEPEKFAEEYIKVFNRIDKVFKKEIPIEDQDDYKELSF